MHRVHFRAHPWPMATYRLEHGLLESFLLIGFANQSTQGRTIQPEGIFQTSGRILDNSGNEAGILIAVQR